MFYPKDEDIKHTAIIQSLFNRLSKFFLSVDSTVNLLENDFKDPATSIRENECNNSNKKLYRFRGTSDATQIRISQLKTLGSVAIRRSISCTNMKCQKFDIKAT